MQQHQPQWHPSHWHSIVVLALMLLSGATAIALAFSAFGSLIANPIGEAQLPAIIIVGMTASALTWLIVLEWLLGARAVFVRPQR